MAEAKLNPQIRKFDIGSRVLKEVELYPLAWRDQEKLLGIAAKAMMAAGVASEQAGGNVTALFESIYKIVTDNLAQILSLCLEDTDADASEKLVNSMTSAQLCEVVNYIVDVNYDVLIKNVKSLREKLSQ